MPLVSIVIPTWNHARFLKIALESVIKQTCTDWEAIVVNNYSDDDTIEVVEDLNDNRIRLVNFQNNGVIGASRNEGINQSRGQYVAFLDSDDSWYPEKLSICLNSLQSGYDWVCHGEVMVYEDGTRKKVIYGPARNASYERFLFHKNCVSTSAVIVSRQLLNEVGYFSLAPLFVTSEDYDLWLRIAKMNKRICFIDTMLGDHGVHPSSASRNILVHLNSTLAVINYHFNLERPKTRFCHFKYRRRISRVFSGNALQLTYQGNWRGGLDLIGNALAYFPCDWKAWVINVFVVVCAAKKMGNTIWNRTSNYLG